MNGLVVITLSVVLSALGVAEEKEDDERRLARLYELWGDVRERVFPMDEGDIAILALKDGIGGPTDSYVRIDVSRDSCDPQCKISAVVKRAEGQKLNDQVTNIVWEDPDVSLDELLKQIHVKEKTLDEGNCPELTAVYRRFGERNLPLSLPSPSDPRVVRVHPSILELRLISPSPDTYIRLYNGENPSGLWDWGMRSIEAATSCLDR